MQPLGLLEAYGQSYAKAVSADGTVIVGNASYQSGYYGFRWTAETGMVPIPSMLAGDTQTSIFDVSPDGLITAGSSYNADGLGRAVVWDSAGGVHDLMDLLTAGGSALVGDWTKLDIAHAVSGNGLTYNVVGWGTIGGQTRGFLATGLTIRAVVDVGNVSSGEVQVPAGQQYNVNTATGGEINATAGSAQIGTLAGATVNTGSAGATVTTLSSGTINTSGGTVATEGGTFTGTITGSGGLSMNGSGTLVLDSANTYGGGTFISSGTVEIARGDAIGSAPIRIANNGKFRAIAGVAVTNTVVAASPAATYEHVLGASDLITNLAPVTNGSAVADIVAGDSAATTVTSSFNANGSISLEGLNGTKFLMVLNLDGYIPQDATPATYYLGWWNEAANGGAGAWVNAVEGNLGANGSLYAAGGYAMGYQAFLSGNGGWNGTTMLGAYGLDVVNQQVWAVIDHNSDFGVTNNGILMVPEPGTLVLAGLGLAGIGLRLGRRRRTLAAGLGLAVAAAVLPSAASAQTAIEVTGGTAATIPGTYAAGTYPSVLVSGTDSTLTVNSPLVIDDTENLFDVLTIEDNGRFIANANVTVTNSGGFSSANANVRSGGILELQSGTFSAGELSLSGATAFQRTSGSYQVQSLSLAEGAAATFRAGDQLSPGTSLFLSTSVNVDTGATLALEQNLSAGFVSLSGSGSTLQRTVQTLAVPELSVSEGASLDLIAGDVVDAISVGNYSGASGNSTINLVPGTTTLVATGLWLLRDGNIPQLASIPYDVDFLSIGGQTVTYRSGSGIEDTIGEFVYVNDSGTLSLQKNLTLTGANAGLQVSEGGTVARNGFSVSAPSLYVSDGGSVTLGQGSTITDGVSVNVNSGAPAATLTLAENLVLTGETAQYGRGLRLSGSGATLVRGEGITITATATDSTLEIANGASFTVRAGDDFTGTSLEASSGGVLTIASQQSVKNVSVAFTDFDTDSPAVLTVNAPLTITDTAARALVVQYGGRLEVNANLTVGDVVVDSSAANGFGLYAGTFTADTMTVTSSSLTRSGGVYDIGSLTVEGSAWSFQAGDSLTSLSLADATFPVAAASFQADAALSLDSLSILGTSVLTLAAFDGSDAFVADYGLRLVGDQATSLTALVTAGRIAAPGFGDLDVAYVAGADATYITVVPEPVATGLAVIGLAAAAAARRGARCEAARPAAVAAWERSWRSVF
jgi:autotransporter-associated beta strand protein